MSENRLVQSPSRFMSGANIYMKSDNKTRVVKCSSGASFKKMKPVMEGDTSVSKVVCKK